jgi:hypothetical protein
MPNVHTGAAKKRICWTELNKDYHGQSSRPFYRLFRCRAPVRKNTCRSRDVGLNGETCYLLIVDHHSGCYHGVTRVSRTSPIHWLSQFVAYHAPDCLGTFVYLYQGGEVYRNPAVHRFVRVAQKPSTSNWVRILTQKTNGIRIRPVERAPQRDRSVGLHSPAKFAFLQDQQCSPHALVSLPVDPPVS